MKFQKKYVMRYLAHSLLVIISLLQLTCNRYKALSVESATQIKSFCDCKDYKGKVDCPGKTYCEAWQWISCECKVNECIGECSSVSKDGYTLTADVLHRITGDSLTKTILLEKKRFYLPILNDLLGNYSAGVFIAKYEDRTIRFYFSDKTLSLLKETRNKLEVA